MKKTKLVPIIKIIVADLDTPLSIYKKVAEEKNSFLLESVEGNDKWSRYSIIGLPSKRSIIVSGQTVTVTDEEGHKDVIETDNPLEFIESYQEEFEVENNLSLPRFSGGLVGYFGFDTIRYIEPKLKSSMPSKTLDTPDIYLLLVTSFIIFDNLKRQMTLVKYAEKDNENQIEENKEFLKNLERKIRISQIKNVNSIQSVAKSNFEAEFEHDQFIDSITKIKEYIRNGDTMQVVIAQRMSTELNARPIDVYRALRYLNPSPYLFYFDFGDFSIVGSSPEILVRLEGDVVTTRPLAGTRKRGESDYEDKQLEEELLNDPKEIAEHLMLIDLGRNDIGKVSEIGSVNVIEKMIVERYSHVMHISSTVEGKLAKSMGPYDVLKATLPVGTLSGAPKVRAIEIIDELEPSKRGIYGGAVGYISWNREMDLAIAIRTAVTKNGRIYIQAGCGVVADSIPEKEWEETINKGKALFKAVELAHNGLNLKS